MRAVVGLVALLIACDAARGSDAPASSASAAAPVSKIEMVKVVSKPLDATLNIEGELVPYEMTAIYARVSSFVSRVLVDRGSNVKKGDLLVVLVAPELGSQRAEAQAKLIADKTTYDRLKAASQTPGAVAGNEVDVAQATMQADQARVQALHAIEQYLTVTAPFDGIITERNVHPGALVGPQGGPSASPMLRIEEVKTLRLTVPVPESAVGAIAEGAKASFTVRSFPGAEFTGVTSRIAHSVDQQTRSMAVELDVDNADGRLAPGMFANVKWPMKRATPSLFVPPGAIVSSTEKTFVVRIRNGVVDQAIVQRGATQGDLVEVFGDLSEGDTIAKRGSEELRNGTHVEPSAPAASSNK